MNESSGSFEVLSSRVDELEKRIHALEHPDEVKASAANEVAGAANAVSVAGADSFQSANIFPLLGRAMLGIAGAYVLRALAEAGMAPKVMVAAAIAYAFAWLVWAARVSKAAGFAPLVYAATSAVILVPMLWEETLHFHILSPSLTAIVLAAFAGLASAFGWRRKSFQPLWLAYCAAAAAAVALSVTTHATSPFVVVLLVIVLLIESARVMGQARPVWPLIALLGDASIWGTIFVYSGPPNTRAEYPELGVTTLVFPACLLFAINATSMAVRAILKEEKIGIFEIVQVMVAFGLAIYGLLAFVSGSATLIGVICLVLSAAGYFASLRLLRRRDQMRNFATFSTWSAALLVAGAFWSLPQAGAGVLLSVAGLTAYAVALRIDSTMLEWHGAAFLCTGAATAGVAQYVFHALASSLPGRPDFAVWIAAGAAIAAYAVGGDTKDEDWMRKGPRLVSALLAVTAVSAFLVHGVVAFAMLAVALDAHHIAFLRTLVVSAVSLCLAYVGPRLGRGAMTLMAYVTLAFIAAKLVFEDLRHGHMEFIAASIFLFAVALIAVPRLVRIGAKSHPEAHVKTPVPIGS